MNSPLKKVTPFIFLKCDTTHHSSTLRSDQKELQQCIGTSIYSCSFRFLRDSVGIDCLPESHAHLTNHKQILKRVCAR